MRRSTRFTLLALGSVAMIATSMKPPPIGFVTLEPSGVEVVQIQYSADETIESQVTVDTQLRDATGGTTAGDLVGIVQAEIPESGAIEALDTQHPFVVGERIEGVGTVAFVLPSPGTARFGGPGGQTSLLSAPGDVFLTLIARGAAVDAQIGLDEEAMADDCNCTVNGSVSQTGVSKVPQPAPAEDGGVSDGGVSDGGVSDGGVSDGGVSDGGVSDGGESDGGESDGGEDAGATDAGEGDAGE